MSAHFVSHCLEKLGLSAHLASQCLGTLSVSAHFASHCLDNAVPVSAFGVTVFGIAVPVSAFFPMVAARACIPSSSPFNQLNLRQTDETKRRVHETATLTSRARPMKKPTKPKNYTNRLPSAV